MKPHKDLDTDPPKPDFSNIIRILTLVSGICPDPWITYLIQLLSELVGFRNFATSLWIHLVPIERSPILK